MKKANVNFCMKLAVGNFFSYFYKKYQTYTNFQQNIMKSTASIIFDEKILL